MSLGKVPIKAGGGAKQNASLEQGSPLSTATQRAATIQSLRPYKELGQGEGPANKGRPTKGSLIQQESTR